MLPEGALRASRECCVSAMFEDCQGGWVHVAVQPADVRDRRLETLRALPKRSLGRLQFSPPTESDLSRGSGTAAQKCSFLPICFLNEADVISLRGINVRVHGR